MGALERLSDVQCKQAKPREKAYKLSDGGGLVLLVNPDGSRYWRWNYRFAGRQKTIAYGAYPGVGLKAARQEHKEARAMLDEGLDPMGERKKAKLVSRLAAETTFEGVGREWFEREKGTWVASHAGRVFRRLEKDVFPWLGTRPIHDISPQEMLAVLRKIQERGAIETAHRAKWACSQIFKYGIETGRAQRDPTELFSAGALRPPVSRSHAAIIDPAKVAELLRSIDAYKGGPVVRAALRLAPLVSCAPESCARHSGASSTLMRRCGKCLASA